jgi:hypothetical protein
MVWWFETVAVVEVAAPPAVDAAGITAAAADAVGAKANAAATPASVGAAAAAEAAGSRTREGLLWAPNGLLSETGALAGSYPGGLNQLRAPDFEEPSESKSGRLGKFLITGRTYIWLLHCTLS